MSDSTPDMQNLSAGDPTLDMAPKVLSRGDSSMGSSSQQTSGPYVEIVEGSDPGLTQETESLLRGRLRLAAGMLFFGYLVFLPQHYFQADVSLPGGRFLLSFHGTMTLLLGVLTGLLCSRRRIPIRRLRLVELSIFGLSVAFMVAMDHIVILRQCAELAQIKAAHTGCEQVRVSLSTGMWILLILTYALFIPNTWRRAAAVIGVMAAAPMLAFLVMMASHEEVLQALSIGELTGFFLAVLVAAVTGVFGVDTIGSLRREAFEARRLGQYRLTQPIGSGGMGEVFLAEHQLMKRPCVVKLIRPDIAGDRQVLARFQREVRATAKLSHWNTIEIFDYGRTEDGTFYYVMEYLPGLSLTQLVEQYGPLQPERAVHFLRQVCDALSEAHAAGLIHRDIKPGNIFAAERGGVYDVAKLLDFGLVKPAVEERSVELTTEGSITGSPLFMSPEQALGDDHPDGRSDIYSLGAVGYYLLTGRPPFEGDKAIKVMIAHAHDKVVPPSELRPDVPLDLQRVILRCLEKAPADRYSSAAALAEALDACESAGHWTRAEATAWWQQNGHVSNSNVNRQLHRSYS